MLQSSFHKHKPRVALDCIADRLQYLRNSVTSHISKSQQGLVLLLLQGCMNEYESIKRQDALILEEELATRQTSDKLAARAAAEKEKKQRKKVSSAAYPTLVQHVPLEVQALRLLLQQSLKQSKTAAGLSDWQRCVGCCSMPACNVWCSLRYTGPQEAHCTV